MTPGLYEACEHAAHVITADKQLLKAGRAGMFILEEIGYPAWLVRPLAVPPLVFLTETGYYMIARNRTFFSKFMFTEDKDKE